MNSTELLMWWVLFLISNVVLAASVGLLAKAGPFARLRVPPILSTFILICGMTLLLVSGKQNLLQETITAIFGS
ncbi:MAG: hypothetical protein AB2385_11650 [Symbiobacterium sp.]|uniref:hypothetical protein n=1 Tax=Symbiobacterium sp. TaxID=1971213 RepID=UPI003464171E